MTGLGGAYIGLPGLMPVMRVIHPSLMRRGTHAWSLGRLRKPAAEETSSKVKTWKSGSLYLAMTTAAASRYMASRMSRESALFTRLSAAAAKRSSLVTRPSRSLSSTWKAASIVSAASSAGFLDKRREAELYFDGEVVEGREDVVDGRDSEPARPDEPPRAMGIAFGAQRRLREGGSFVEQGAAG